MKQAVSYVLFKARHAHKDIDSLPALFSGEVHPTDFVGFDREMSHALDEYWREHKEMPREINVYVTGLTAAVIAVVNWCLLCELPLTLWHYDWEKDAYVRQPVWTDYHYRERAHEKSWARRHLREGLGCTIE